MQRHFSTGAIVGIFLCMSIPSLGTAAEKKHSISLEAPPQAQVLQIDYYLKVIQEFGGGKPAMHFEVKIKNLSEKPERFSVTVSTPDGASAAGFVPAKATKEGGLAVLEPKEEGKITLPLMTEELAQSFSVLVETEPAE